MSKKNGFGDPTALKPFDADDKNLLRVVIETPKGSRNKFSFHQAEHIFGLKTVIPAGMAFPYDFGFVPSTRADDGDPIDVLVLMDEPAFAGCALTCRRGSASERLEGCVQLWKCPTQAKTRLEWATLSLFIPGLSDR